MNGKGAIQGLEGSGGGGAARKVCYRDRYPPHMTHMKHMYPPPHMTKTDCCRDKLDASGQLDDAFDSLIEV
jgi:hypothetical protein